MNSFLASYSSFVKPSQNMAFEWVEIVIEYPSRDNFSSFISEIETKNEFEIQFGISSYKII